MTNGEKFKEVFGYEPATDAVVCNKEDWCGASEPCNYCISNPNNIGREEDWWNSEYEEPTTKNDSGVDLISRSDVLKLMQDNWHTHNGDWAMQESMDDIRALPSVTPQEPRKGHWISHREHCEMNNLRPSGLGSYFWCSECDCGIDSNNFSRVNYNYCPNCGADMREVEE